MHAHPCARTDGEGCPANWKPGKKTIEANPDGSKTFFKAMAGKYGKD